MVGVPVQPIADTTSAAATSCSTRLLGTSTTLAVRAEAGRFGLELRPDYGMRPAEVTGPPAVPVVRTDAVPGLV